jgi:hypothetical protein
MSRRFSKFEMAFIERFQCERRRARISLGVAQTSATSAFGQQSFSQREAAIERQASIVAYKLKLHVVVREQTIDAGELRRGIGDRASRFVPITQAPHPKALRVNTLQHALHKCGSQLRCNDYSGATP